MSIAADEYLHDQMRGEESIRKLRYRLNRQGMLELDEWLKPLDRALKEAWEHGDSEVVTQVESLIATDTPELLAMMHGEIPLPESLRSWLS